MTTSRKRVVDASETRCGGCRILWELRKQVTGASRKIMRAFLLILRECITGARERPLWVVKWSLKYRKDLKII